MEHDSTQLITRGVVEVIDRKHLEERLQRGEKLRVKLGIDPTRPELHIGHGVPLRKLRQFQDAGHTAVLIIGDYTAQLGDPTDRTEARKILSVEEVKQNAEGYLEQAYKILDKDKTEVHFQSEWFGAFDLRTVIELLATTTVNHMLSHETFHKRLTEGNPLHVHELMYPLLQGYDSVAIRADVELGASEQKFNLLMGRTVQRAHNLPEQDVMLVPYLPGTDGSAKMSKSLGNTINLTDTPEDMYGKVMSIPDGSMPQYFELATQLPGEKIADYLKQLEAGNNPRDIKAALAKQIVCEYYNEAAAHTAEAHFDAVFRKKQTPDDIEVLKLKPGNYDIIAILTTRTTLVSSKSEARRLIGQNGVKLGGSVVSDPGLIITESVGDVVLQVGSRRFVKLEWVA